MHCQSLKYMDVHGGKGLVERKTHLGPPWEVRGRKGGREVSMVSVYYSSGLLK